MPKQITQREEKSERAKLIKNVHLLAVSSFIGGYK